MPLEKQFERNLGSVSVKDFSMFQIQKNKSESVQYCVCKIKLKKLAKYYFIHVIAKCNKVYYKSDCKSTLYP